MSTVGMRHLGVLVAVVAIVMGLAGCGSGGSGSSASTPSVDDTSADRQAAFLIPLSTEVCLRDGTYEFTMTTKFRNNQNSNGNGPFPLHGGWCGQNAEVLRADLYDADGTNVLYVGAGNPELGYPKMTVTCRPGAKSDPGYRSEDHSFKDGESYTFACKEYKVVVVRQSDTDTLKRFDVEVRRA